MFLLTCLTGSSLVVEVNGHLPGNRHEKRLDCFRRPCYTHKHLKNSRAPVLLWHYWLKCLVSSFSVFIINVVFFSIHHRCSFRFIKMLYHAIPCYTMLYRIATQPVVFIFLPQDASIEPCAGRTMFLGGMLEVKIASYLWNPMDSFGWTTIDTPFWGLNLACIFTWPNEQPIWEAVQHS